MGWSTNQKALQKREKQANKKKQQQSKKQQKKEKQKWKDDVTQKKQQTAQQKQEKRLQQLARKRQLKQIAAREQAQMQKNSKKQKNQFAQKKLTQAEILQRQQQRLMQQMQINEQNEQEAYFPQENVNKNLQGYEIAATVDQALNLLDNTQERHPERRFKAAFQAYCQKRQEQIKIDYPKMKRSQRLQMLRKEFQKHPQNPYNKKNVVAYNHNPNKKKQQEETEYK